MSDNPYKDAKCLECRIHWRCDYKTIYYEEFVTAIVNGTPPPECPFFEELRKIERGIYNNE